MLNRVVFIYLVICYAKQVISFVSVFLWENMIVTIQFSLESLRKWLYYPILNLLKPETVGISLQDMQLA